MPETKLQEARRLVREMREAIPHNESPKFFRVFEMRDLPPQKYYFEIGKEYVDIYCGGYEYSIELNRLKNEADVLRLMCHLGTKSWPLMDCHQLVRLGDRLCRARGFPLYPQGDAL